jgi:hypothetical protein
MHIVAAALLLTARFYTIADVPAGDRVTATQVTANILHAAGIDILWVNCDDRVSAHRHLTRNECMTPPNPDEVIVRWVSAQISPDRLNRSGADRLGDAYVDTSAASGTLATVYVDRVALMARSAGLDTGTLIGRVMAHEIGHLLLGTANHQPSGLMRAEWSTTLLQRRIANDWRFSTRDAASAREGVLKRVRVIQPTRTAESSPSTLPCAEALKGAVQATCPTCPVCATLLPADWVALHLLVEPGF